MKRYPYRFLILLILMTGLSSQIFADNTNPWGVAISSDQHYIPRKVVYDLNSGDLKTVQQILNRASYLYRIYDSDPFESSIIIVIHGNAIPLFTIAQYHEYLSLMTRANSLVNGTTIQFKLCQLDAISRGYKPSDIHGFVKMVPMADAEIVKLQYDGYAYLR